MFAHLHSSRQLLQVLILGYIVGGGGQGRLTQLVLRDRTTGGTETVPAAGLFVLIGAQPHTAWLPAELARDEVGYLRTGLDLPAHATDGRSARPFETSLPGVFAVGDVRHGSVKRVASSVGEGAVAIRMVHEHLSETPAPESAQARPPTQPEPLA